MPTDNNTYESIARVYRFKNIIFGLSVNICDICHYRLIVGKCNKLIGGLPIVNNVEMTLWMVWRDRTKGWDINGTITRDDKFCGLPLVDSNLSLVTN